jgi:hypothetical protein
MADRRPVRRAGRRGTRPQRGVVCLGAIAVAVLLLPALGLSRIPPGAPGFGAPVSVADSAVPANLSGTWSLFAPTPGQPAARSGAALAFDPVEGLGVLFGGRAGNATILNDTWVDDGDTPGHWGLAPHAIHVAPPPLLNAAMAFDATLNEFLLFGGELADGRAYNGTWAFGSFQWTNLTANLRSSPPADLSPTMAFDPSTGEVVLVSSADPGATWTFGSGGWNQLPATDWVEPPVVNATAIEDPLFGGVLLFGGDSPGTGSPPLNGTWSFLDVGWVGAARPAAPPAEARPAMSYDPRIPGVLLYSSAASVSTWTYTATGWNPVLGGPLPPARTGTQLYYDSDASYDSLFGGVAANGTAYEDNWGWSVPPSVLTPTLGAASISTVTWVELGGIIAVPVLIAFLLRRRPPKALPTDAPASSPSTAPS